MPEADTIHPDTFPLTIESLAEQFAACGLAGNPPGPSHRALMPVG